MPFTKGDKNINLEGRPKGSGRVLTSLLKEELEKIPEGQKVAYKTLFVKKLLKKALVDNDIQALKLIMNYVDNLPMQQIAVAGDVESLKIMFDTVFNKDVTTPTTKGDSTK